MKSFFLILVLGCALLLCVFVGARLRPAAPIADDGNAIALCGSSTGTAAADSEGKFIPHLSGWGNISYPITTTSDSTQYYFNQGLGFYYGYHFTEALASFKEASRFDPRCVMAYWGQALAMGPYYNTYYYKMKKEIPEVIASMASLPVSLPEKEKLLINAMTQRYSNDFSNSDRNVLDKKYAAAMGQLAGKYQSDFEISSLYIDAVMLEHKWDFWDTQSVPRPWTPEVMALCESVLKQNKQHPAILHYYIHLAEASHEAQRALPAADLLRATVPGIAHMVHMSSHMYQRNGFYRKGVQANDEANTVGNDVDNRAPQLGLGKDKSIHYSAVQSYCAMMAGNYAKAKTSCDRTRDRQLKAKPAFEKDPYAQFIYMFPVIARVRMGKWDEIESEAKVDPAWKYAAVLDNFARGLAFVRKNNLADAKVNLAKIKPILGDSLLNIRLMPFNNPAQSCKIAFEILSGEIAFAEGKSEEAIGSFQKSVDEEEQMVYREPPDWLIPPRQYLGFYLLKLRRINEARKVYQKDLTVNPGNGWSLVGMSRVLAAEGKTAEANSYKAKAAVAFEGTDLVIVGSIF